MEKLTLLDIVILCLATFRAAQLVALDDGPFEIFKRLRVEWTIADVSALLSCPYCIGVWFAAIFTCAMLSGNQAVYVGLIILAVAGGQAAIQGIIDK